jgi:hypothetical protein
MVSIESKTMEFNLGIALAVRPDGGLSIHQIPRGPARRG